MKNTANKDGQTTSKKDIQRSPSVVVRCDAERGPLANNFEARGWLQWFDGELCSDCAARAKGVHTSSAAANHALSSTGKGKWCPSGPHRWNILWGSGQLVKQVCDPGFSTGSSSSNIWGQGMNPTYRLGDDQIVNHFPNFYELTRKDLMTKHIKRYCKGRAAIEGSLSREGFSWEFVPLTMPLSNLTEFNMFLDEAKRFPANTRWIVKPVSGSQGRNITIFSKKKDIRIWLSERDSDIECQDRNFIISLYVDRPLLVGRKKFDVRIYVLCLTFSPLRALIHESGSFARFCSTSYEGNDTDDLDSHLTNVAVQKHTTQYNSTHGGKWPLEHLYFYLESSSQATTVSESEKVKSAGSTKPSSGAGCKGVVQRLKDNIDFVIGNSLKSVQAAMDNDKHSFELYGYDILIDEDLRPWLIEVNASPSLAGTTRSDTRTKTMVLNDTFNLVVPPGFPSTASPSSAPSSFQGAGSSSTISYTPQPPIGLHRTAREIREHSSSGGGYGETYVNHRRKVMGPLGGFRFVVDESRSRTIPFSEKLYALDLEKKSLLKESTAISTESGSQSSRRK